MKAIKYSVDVRYQENGLLKFVAGMFNTAEEAEAYLSIIQLHLHDHLYAELGVCTQ